MFVCRNSDSANLIEREGVAFEDLGSLQRFHVRAAAVVGERFTAERLGAGPILLCVRTQQTQAVAKRLGDLGLRCPVAVVQNGLIGQRMIEAVHPTVLGAVYRQTCTRRSPNSVVTAGAGRMIIGGSDPSGKHAAVTLAKQLAGAGYDVGVSDEIEHDKWLKLCINLMSAPNALIRREDHESAAFVEIKTTLLEEALTATRAAGLVVASCDGRDRSLEEEIVFQRGALERGTSRRSLPLYNQVWSALHRGDPVEADGYHRQILELSLAQAVPAPMNAKVLAALERAADRGFPPESYSADEILAFDPNT